MTPAEHVSIVALLQQIEKRIDGRLDGIERSIEGVHGRISSSERRTTAEHDEVKAAVADLGARVDNLESVVDKGRGAKALVAFVAVAVAALAILDYLPPLPH